MMDSMRKVYLIQSIHSKIHSRMVNSLDSLQLDSVPGHPSKFLVDVEVFEEMAKSVTELHERDTELKEAIQVVFENLQSLEGIKRMARNLRQHLDLIQKRIERDQKFIHSVFDKTSRVICTFRDRCKQEFSEFLMYIDGEIRRILKPLVPSKAIEENLNSPLISHPSLNSLNQSFREMMGNRDETPASSHTQMLVDSLEKVSNDLIQILGETNLKYFEFVCPNEGMHTPVGAPLPEYFQFTQQEHSDRDFQLNASPVEEKAQEIIDDGKSSNSGSERIHLVVKNNEFDTFLKDNDLSLSKKENVVFQIIHDEKVKIDKNYGRSKKVVHKIQSKPRITKNTGLSTPIQKTLSTKARDNLNHRKNSITKQRSELKVRSITPRITQQKRSVRYSKTPLGRKKNA